MGIPGASRFTNAATLANLQNRAAQGPGSILGGTSVSLLDVGRGLQGDNGIGLSRSARALNRQFLNQSQGLFNSLFSSTRGNTSSVEQLQTQIRGLRASLPESQISPALRGNTVDTEA